jgi:hypothetical protein
MRFLTKIYYYLIPNHLKTHDGLIFLIHLSHINLQMSIPFKFYKPLFSNLKQYPIKEELVFILGVLIDQITTQIQKKTFIIFLFL